MLLSGYVRTAAALALDTEAGFLAQAPTRDAAMPGYSTLLRYLTEKARFPALHAVLDAGVFDRADRPDDEFVFGLERILVPLPRPRPLPKHPGLPQTGEVTDSTKAL